MKIWCILQGFADHWFCRAGGERQGKRQGRKVLRSQKKLNFFDRSEKSDVDYKAQLIAAKQARRSEVFRIAGIIKNIQPISVGV